MSSILYRGLQLNGTEAPYLLRAAEGLVGGVGVDSPRDALLGRHGVRYGSWWRRERIVDIEVDVVCWSESELNAAVGALAAVLADVEASWPLEVTMPGVAAGNPARLDVRPAQWSLPVDTTYGNWAAQAAVQFVAADPRWRSQVEHLASVTVASESEGFTFDLTFSFTFGAAGSPGVIVITNAGTVATTPELRIHGPVTDPVVRNETTGTAVSLDLDLAAGSFVDISWADGALSVLLNGTASRYSSLVDADRLDLVPGANSIRFGADVATAGFVEVRWRDAWL